MDWKDGLTWLRCGVARRGAVHNVGVGGAGRLGREAHVVDQSAVMPRWWLVSLPCCGVSVACLRELWRVAPLGHAHERLPPCPALSSASCRPQPRAPSHPPHPTANSQQPNCLRSSGNRSLSPLPSNSCSPPTLSSHAAHYVYSPNDSDRCHCLNPAGEHPRVPHTDPGAPPRADRADPAHLPETAPKQRPSLGFSSNTKLRRAQPARTQLWGARAGRVRG